MRFETRGGAFRYGAGGYVLRGVNFSLESGERLSILGANGAGKTTLIRCAAGLRAWSEGATYLDGAEVRGLPPREFRRRVKKVFDEKGVEFPFPYRSITWGDSSNPIRLKIEKDEPAPAK